MAYRNQNYMTNKKIKAAVDKNQKGYVDPNQQQEEEFVPIKYAFISYGDAGGETLWGEGYVETTGVEENGYTEVEVKNNTEPEFIGQKFFIASNAQTNGTIYPLYSDAGTTTAGIYVSISEYQELAPQEEEEEEFTPVTYNFISYGDAEGETEWGRGTVETTGVESNGYTQVEIKTNSTEQEFVGQKVYITSNAQTDGTLYQLYSDAGTTALGIYVSVSTPE